MKDEIHSTSINPDVVEQFLALMNTHCKSSEEALAMLSTLCYNLMVTCGIHSMGKRKLTAVCSHQTRIGNLDAHLI